MLSRPTVLIGFGHAPPGAWMLFELVGGRNKPIDEQSA